MPPNLHRYESEKYYYDPHSKSKTLFPSISDAGTISLSVVIPAYNEENRSKWTLVVFYFSCIFVSFKDDIHVTTFGIYIDVLVPVMMEETMSYLEERRRQDSNFTYEVIIVDDGSKDATSKVCI